MFGWMWGSVGLWCACVAHGPRRPFASSSDHAPNSLLFLVSLPCRSCLGGCLLSVHVACACVPVRPHGASAYTFVIGGRGTNGGVGGRMCWSVCGLGDRVVWVGV